MILIGWLNLLGENYLRLVDFPGFGYAKASKSSILSWNRLIKSFIRYRSSLIRVYLLVDARRGITNSDNETMIMFDKLAISYQLVITKIDKLNSKELSSVFNSVKEKCKTKPAAHPFIHLTSSVKGIGIKFLRADIARMI